VDRYLIGIHSTSLLSLTLVTAYSTIGGGTSPLDVINITTSIVLRARKKFLAGEMQNPNKSHEFFKQEKRLLIGKQRKTTTVLPADFHPTPLS